MGKAPAVRSADAFFEVLQKSRLLTEEQLAEVKESTAGQTDPKAIARGLLKQNLLTRWQAGQLLAGYFALRIGKYKLCEALGRGELGRVFIAEHGQLGRRVALKTLSREHTQQEDVLERFLQEMRKIADLDHRNIIHFYDIDDEDGRYFLVTEFAEGQNLDKYVEERGPLDFRTAARIAKQAAEGLVFLHERGLTHHDLKPSNLVVTPAGDVKLLDVGVGRLRDAMLGKQVNSSGEAMVGPRYLSPEQVAGQPADHRSDQFSLGCLLYFMLTGTPPFPRATSPFGSLTDVDEIRPDTPAVLAKLCDRLMQLKAGDRNETAPDVIQRLEGWLGVDPADAIASDTAEVQEEGTVLTRSDDTSVVDVGPAAQAASEAASETSGATQFAGIAEAASEAPGAISIKTKKRRGAGKAKSKAKANAQAPAAADAEASADAKPKPAAKKGDSKKLILIIAGGALAAIVVMALIAFMVLGGLGGSAVANNDNQENVKPEDAADQQNGGGTGEVGDPEIGDPEIGDPEIGDPEIDDPEIDDPEIGDPPAEDTGNTTQPVNTEPGNTEPGNTEPGAGTAPNEAAADVKPNGGTGPMAGGNAPMPMETKSTPPSKPANPADKKPPGNKPPGNKPPANKPTANKPGANKPNKTDAKVKKDPLAGIPRVTELPPLFDEEGSVAEKAFEPKPLGTIVLAEKVLCSIYMRGGEGAVRGKKIFTIQNANSGLAEREWDIRLQGSSEIGAEGVIAKLEIKDDNKLYFQWTQDAAKDPVSAHLINCMLNINLTVGGATKDLALRKPVVVEPITLEMEARSGAKSRWEIPTPPNPDKVFLTVSKLPPPFPKHTREPDKAVPADKGGQLIRLGEKEADQVMVLKVDTSFKRNVEVNVTAWAQFSKAAKMERINKTSLKKMEQAVTIGMQRAGLRVQQLALVKVPGNDRGKKQLLDQQKNLANQEMATMTEMNGKMEKLKALFESLNGQGKIGIRVHYQTESGDVTLLRTE